MTYHLWSNGADTGPFTRNEIEERNKRGELVGIFWRRTGDTQYRPFDELSSELNPSSEVTPGVDPDPEPSGSSSLGMLTGALGGIAAMAGLLGLLFNVALGAALIGGGLGLLGLGTLFDIQAKLALIAHRVKR